MCSVSDTRTLSRTYAHPHPRTHAPIHTQSGFIDLQSGWHYSRIKSAPCFPHDFATCSVLSTAPSVLQLHGVRDVAVTRCTFNHTGTGGVGVDGGSARVVISGCAFNDTSASAVTVGGVGGAPVVPLLAWNITVQDCVVVSPGAEYAGCSAVFAGYVANLSFVHNSIVGSPNGGVTIGWGWGRFPTTMERNLVVGNRIERANGVLYDLGSVYTLSAQPQSEVAFNFIAGQHNLYGECNCSKWCKDNGA